MSAGACIRAVTVALAVTVTAVPTAQAAPVVSGPAVTIDDDEVEPGGRVVVTVDGFTSRNVTIAVCGNEARRGSSDCEMTASQQIRFQDDGSPTWTRFVVLGPAQPCPCVVRVTSPDNDEVAVVPIAITGHPVGPVVDPPSFGDLVDVEVAAGVSRDGVLDGLRSGLGGPATYDVTVTVRNIGPAALRRVQLSVDGFRGSDALPPFAVDAPGLIGVGQTWQQTVSVRVPTPSFGAIRWRAIASGAGQPVVAETTTNHRPVLLIALVVILVVDAGVLAIRFTLRRRAARDAAVPAGELDDAPASREPVRV